MIHSPVAQPEVAGILARLRFTAVPLADTLRNTGQGCCPVKMVESMAAGIPVVASDLAVCREWVAHGCEAWLVPPGDGRAWAQAIYRLFSDDALIRRLGEAARQTAQLHFSWSTVHSRLDRVFQQTAAIGGTV
jgi:glycosyltransferase involved in cell wall biosynthesis